MWIDGQPLSLGQHVLKLWALTGKFTGSCDLNSVDDLVERTHYSHSMRLYLPRAIAHCNEPARRARLVALAVELALDLP